MLWIRPLPRPDDYSLHPESSYGWSLTQSQKIFCSTSWYQGYLVWFHRAGTVRQSSQDCIAGPGFRLEGRHQWIRTWSDHDLIVPTTAYFSTISPMVLKSAQCCLPVPIQTEICRDQSKSHTCRFAYHWRVWWVFWPGRSTLSCIRRRVPFYYFREDFKD